MSNNRGIINSLFIKLGWVLSIDSNGFEVYSIPDEVELNEYPSSWDPSAMDNKVYIDDISYEEPENNFGGNVHLAILNCIDYYINVMIKNRSTFIVFPKFTSKAMMIESILEVFPDKYTREQLNLKDFIVSSGRRKCRNF